MKMKHEILMCLFISTFLRQIKAYGEEVHPSNVESEDKVNEGSYIPINTIVNSDTGSQPVNSNTNGENQGAFNFDRDQYLGQGDASGISFVGNVDNSDSNNINTGTGAHEYVFPDNGDGQPVFDGVSMVDNGTPAAESNMPHMKPEVDNSNVQTLNDHFGGIPGGEETINDNIGAHEHVFPNGDGSQTVFDGVSWTNDENTNTGSSSENNVNVVQNTGENTGASTWDEQLSQIPGVKFVGTVDSDHTFDDSMNGQTVFEGVKWVDNVDMPEGDNRVGQVLPGDGVLGGNDFNGNIGTVDQSMDSSTGNGAETVWKPKNCYLKGVTYEEGSGVRSSVSPCLMYICEEGRMLEYPTACYMNGMCYAEGTTWTYGCAEYTCQLSHAGYHAVQISKRCQFQTKQGDTKCLRDGEVVRDGPCRKRRCTISKVNDKLVTELPLIENFGGCGYAKGCRSLGEVWTYRCVIKRCMSDGQNFIKLPLHANCIRKGRCYNDGQSYTTPNTCVTRTCVVNDFINKAWFVETSRGCRFQGMCINEGEKRIRQCKEYTCTKQVSNIGRFRMTMKMTNKNACLPKTSYR